MGYSWKGNREKTLYPMRSGNGAHRAEPTISTELLFWGEWSVFMKSIGSKVEVSSGKRKLAKNGLPFPMLETTSRIQAKV